MDGQAKKYTISEVQQRNEWQSPTGGTMIDYALSSEQYAGVWLKLTQKLETKPPQPGDVIEGIVLEKKDRNGNTYHRLKKVSGNSGAMGGGGFSSKGLQEVNDKLDTIIKHLNIASSTPAPAASSDEELSKDELSDLFPDM